MTTTDAEAIARAKGHADRIRWLLSSYLASRREAQEAIQITMQDVRLMAGEGPLSAKDTLAGVNAYLRMLHRHRRIAPPSPAPAGEVERLRAAIKRQVENIDRWRETGEPASPEESKSIYEQLVAALNGGREKGK